jgi:outer membrane protein OmpA-like peptidoglycan-associated protein
MSSKRGYIPVTLLSLTMLACGGGQPAKSPEPGESAASASAPESESGAGMESAEASDDSSAAADEGGDEGGGEGNVFKDTDTHTAKDTHGVKKSTLKPSKTEALLKFVVVDKKKGPVEGVVISLAGPDGKKYYTEETDSTGFADVLVPPGKKYDLVFLSLGRNDVAASTTVDDKPNFTMKLTLRYKGWTAASKAAAPRFVLDGVNFDTGKATIRKESFPRLDRVVEYMAHKKSVRIQISGHTDNVGNKAANKALSENRAKACRQYLIKKGIDGSRIEAVGYGDEKPVASNDTAEGRQENRRIEAIEL